MRFSRHIRNTHYKGHLMSAAEVNIEQRIVQAGIECHSLVQTIHDHFKAHYVREELDLHHPLGLVKAHAARFLKLLSGSQSTPRLFVNTTLIASFGGLHVADGIITYLGLTFAEVAEINPVLNYFTGLMGLGVSITVLKLMILGLLSAIFIDRRTIKSRWGTATLALAVMFYSGVVINNVLLVVGL